MFSCVRTNSHMYYSMIMVIIVFYSNYHGAHWCVSKRWSQLITILRSDVSYNWFELISCRSILLMRHCVIINVINMTLYSSRQICDNIFIVNQTKYICGYVSINRKQLAYTNKRIAASWWYSGQAFSCSTALNDVTMCCSQCSWSNKQGVKLLLTHLSIRINFDMFSCLCRYGFTQYAHWC